MSHSQCVLPSCETIISLIDADGGAKLIKKVYMELPRAGAAVTCGISNLMGLSRHPITDDYLALAVNVASLLNLAASSTDKMDTAVPLLPIQSEEWDSSGLLETVSLLRETIRVDNMPGKPKDITAKRKPP